MSSLLCRKSQGVLFSHLKLQVQWKEKLQDLENQLLKLR